MTTPSHRADHSAPPRPAETSAPIHAPLANRWSTRRFDAQARLDDATITALLEAARWAPSAFNGQPWRWLVFVPGEGQRAVVEDALNAGNYWAKSAAALFVAVARVHAASGDENRWRQHDVGLSAMSLVVEASARGLASHGMAGFDGDAMHRGLQIPDGFEIVAVWAVGPWSEDAELGDKHAGMETGPRRRRSLAAMSARGGWDPRLEHDS